MPRAAGDPQVSDNAVEAGHDIIHGGPKTTEQVDVSHSNKVAPLPEGLEEVHDAMHSGGGSGVNPPFHGSGKGGQDPKKEEK